MRRDSTNISQDLEHVCFGRDIRDISFSDCFCEKITSNALNYLGPIQFGDNVGESTNSVINWVKDLVNRQF